MLRICVALAILAQASAAHAAQDFGNLPERLKAGDSIVVTSDDGTAIRGRVLSAERDRIVLSTPTGTTAVVPERVSRVQLRRNGVLFGTLIGAVAGIPFGVALKAYVHNEGGSEAGALAFPVAVGAGAGLAIDALLVRPRTVFERRVPPRTVVSVRVTRQSGGLRFARLF